jgi:hypothetical protein
MDDQECAKIETLAEQILPEFEQKLHQTGWTLEKNEVISISYCFKK